MNSKDRSYTGGALIIDKSSFLKIATDGASVIPRSRSFHSYKIIQAMKVKTKFELFCSGLYLPNDILVAKRVL